MDEIASRLGTSKRTIYEFFKSKEDLVIACLDSTSQKLKIELERINSIQDILAATKELFNIVVSIYDSRYRFAESFCKDIRYFPKAYEFMDINNGLLHEATKAIYERGIKEGLAKDIGDLNMLESMWLCYNTNNMHQSHQRRVTPQEFARTMEAFMWSLCTDKGKKIVETINQ